MTERDPSALHLDCQTCLAANTTACGDCIVAHVLANDDGPIELVSTGLTVAPPGPSTGDESDPHVERAVDLLAKAGLLDAEPVWVDRSAFEAVESRPALVPVR